MRRSPLDGNTEIKELGKEASDRDTAEKVLNALIDLSGVPRDKLQNRVGLSKATFTDGITWLLQHKMIKQLKNDNLIITHPLGKPVHILIANG